MMPRLSTRYTFLLLGLLAMFAFFQAAVLVGYEVHEWRVDGEIHLREEAFEVLVLFFCGVATLPLMWVVIRRMIRTMLAPLNEINRAAGRIIEGRLEERIRPDHADDELGQLALTLNAAFDRYKDAVDRLHRFSSDASHQLRTPLTAMRVAGEIGLQRERPAPEYREIIGSMLEDAGRLSGMVEKLLVLARLGSEQARTGFAAVDAGAQLRLVAEQYAPLWRSKGLDLRLVAEPGCLVQGDPALLQQMLSNLLDNAVAHTPAGGRITVAAVKAHADRTVALTLSDTGPGIPEPMRQRLFERFSHGPGSAGTGLGLAIVADIVRLHGGTIALTSPPGSGATFRIELPALPPSS